MTVAELIDLLMGFPEEETVFIPAMDSQLNYVITNAVLTNNGVALDYDY